MFVVASARGWFAWMFVLVLFKCCVCDQLISANLYGWQNCLVLPLRSTIFRASLMAAMPRRWCCDACHGLRSSVSVTCSGPNNQVMRVLVLGDTMAKSRCVSGILGSKASYMAICTKAPRDLKSPRSTPEPEMFMEEFLWNANSCRHRAPRWSHTSILVLRVTHLRRMQFSYWKEFNG